MVLDTFPERHRLSVHPLPPDLRYAQTVVIWRKGARSPKLDALVEIVAGHAAAINARDARRPASAKGRGGAGQTAWRSRRLRVPQRSDRHGRTTTSSYAGSASWEAPRSIISPAAASACSGSIALRPAMIAARRMARPASSASPISSIRPMCRCVRRAYELWRELETEAGRPLLHVTGIAEIGPPDGTLVTGTLAAARLHDIPHELIAAPELMRRYPAFRLPPHYVGVVQPDGGFVEAEPSVQALLRAGAEARRRDSLWRDRSARSSRETTRRARRDRRRARSKPAPSSSRPGRGHRRCCRAPRCRCA